jgi:hypothetical protein
MRLTRPFNSRINGGEPDQCDHEPNRAIERFKPPPHCPHEIFRLFLFDRFRRLLLNRIRLFSRFCLFLLRRFTQVRGVPGGSTFS